MNANQPNPVAHSAQITNATTGETTTVRVRDVLDLAHIASLLGIDVLAAPDRVLMNPCQNCGENIAPFASYCDQACFEQAIGYLGR